MQHPDHFHLIPFAKVEYTVIFTDQKPIIGMDRKYGIQRHASLRHVPEALDAGAEQLEDALGGVGIGQLVADIIADADQIPSRRRGNDHICHVYTPSPSKASSIVRPPSLRRDSTPLESSVRRRMVASCFS